MSDSLEHALADLERRVNTLEIKIAALPAAPIETHITEPIKPLPPTFKDVELPIPDVQTIVATAKVTWSLLAMFSELNLLFWTLVDRRYHMAWVTRILATLLLAAILLSHFVLPFARWDTAVSPILDKAVDLFLGLILFTVLSFETRRYKEWRGQQ